MITLSSLEEIKATNEALGNLKQDFPNLFNKLLHVVNLTRALQFKYQFMGSLIMDENTDDHTPSFVYGSVLRLYKKELQKLIDDIDSPILKDILADNKHIGYAKIFQLVLGKSPESLIGSSPIQ
jgi:hypothetical protein